MDGVILIGTAYLREPYGQHTEVYGYDDPDYRGVLAVLPAICDEAVIAPALIEGEEAAQGNDIESFSNDAVGYNGPAFKALGNDACGPQLTGYVPPKPEWSATPGLYQPDDFKLLMPR